MIRLFLFCLLAASSHAQWNTSRIHGSPEAPKPYVPEQVFTQIALNDALEMIAVPGVHRLVAVEKGGKIWSFKDSPDAASKDLLIDLKPDHPARGYVNHLPAPAARSTVRSTSAF